MIITTETLNAETLNPLRKNSIDTLEVNCINMSMDQLKQLGEALRDNISLTSLHLHAGGEAYTSPNNSKEVVAIVRNIMIHNTNLKALNFSDNYFRAAPASLSLIADALAKTQARLVNLSRNDFGPDAVPAFAKALTDRYLLSSKVRSIRFSNSWVILPLKKKWQSQY